MFRLAMKISFVLDYNILVVIDHVLANVNTIFNFPDQSKLIFNNINLPVSMEEQLQSKTQILNAFVDQLNTIDINLISQLKR